MANAVVDSVKCPASVDKNPYNVFLTLSGLINDVISEDIKSMTS